MKTFLTLLLFALLMNVDAQAQQPKLNSFAGASATIYLDFDGQLVNGTSWNWNGPISCNPSNLNNEQVTEIFNRIAEDYRPFNINITTDSTKYLAAPVLQRTRVIFTTTSEWYGPAGGVAFIGSFTWGDNTPAFVFSALLGYNPKRIAEAAAHEAGHTLGLKHQSSYDNNCTKTSEYHYGNGVGEIAWAPIMGAGYYRNFTLWNNGANPYGCTEYQDDLSIITSVDNGFGYRTDDHSSSFSLATDLPLTNNQLSAGGIIERTNDQDVFKFFIPVSGAFHLDAIPYNLGAGNVGSNLDMQVELFNQNETLVATYNPTDYLNLTIDTNLLPGSYYLKVQGKGNIYAPEYASLGSYNLTASYTPSVALPLRNFELSGAALSGLHKLKWNIDADETVIDQKLEVSPGQTLYSPLSQVAASERSYQYLPGTIRQLYYRLKVKFDNGHEYYSNVVKIPSDKDLKKPAIAPVTNAQQLVITSPEAYSWIIADYSGRIMAQGRISEGTSTVATSYLAPGIYFIKFQNENGQFAEKFFKQ